MSSLTIQLPPDLDARLQALAAERGADRADVARDLIETGLASLPPASSAGTPRSLDLRPFPEGRSAFDMMRGLCGILDGPGDLSTNPDHMEGFGEE